MYLISPWYCLRRSIFTATVNRCRPCWPLALRILWGDNCPNERLLIVLAVRVKIVTSTPAHLCWMIANFSWSFKIRPWKFPLPKVCIYMFSIERLCFWVCGFALSRCDSTKRIGASLTALTLIGFRAINNVYPLLVWQTCCSRRCLILQWGIGLKAKMAVYCLTKITLHGWSSHLHHYHTDQYHRSLFCSTHNTMAMATIWSSLSHHCDPHDSATIITASLSSRPLSAKVAESVSYRGGFAEVYMAHKYRSEVEWNATLFPILQLICRWYYLPQVNSKRRHTRSCAGALPQACVIITTLTRTDLNLTRPLPSPASWIAIPDRTSWLTQTLFVQNRHCRWACFCTRGFIYVSVYALVPALPLWCLLRSKPRTSQTRKTTRWRCAIVVL